MKIDKKLFDEVAKLAAESPRLRMNYDLRNDGNEQSQRMLNVLLPGTMSPIHRHQDTAETVVCIQGECIERYYDNEGNETEMFRLVAGGELVGLQIPTGQFHSLEAADEMSVIIEFKAGAYEPFKTEDILNKA